MLVPLLVLGSVLPRTADVLLFVPAASDVVLLFRFRSADVGSGFERGGGAGSRESLWRDEGAML